MSPYGSFRQFGSKRSEFDRFFSGYPFPAQREHSLGELRVEIYDTEYEVIVTCDLPGLEKEEDVQLEIEDNILHINGTTNSKNENSNQKEEYLESNFHKSITLPDSVSHEEIKAIYQNGNLEVKIPKQTTGNKKRIEVDFH